MEQNGDRFVGTSNLRPVRDLALVDRLKLLAAQAIDLHVRADDHGVEKGGNGIVGELIGRLHIQIGGGQVDLPVLQRFEAGAASMIPQGDTQAGAKYLVIAPNLLEQRSQVRSEE